MLRRALLSLVPALLALACLSGTPTTSIGGPDTSAASWSTGTAGTLAARGSLTQDLPDIAVNQSADEDDTPDARIVRVATAIVWPNRAFPTRILYASHRAADRHRPCAAPPRAPPTA